MDFNFDAMDMESYEDVPPQPPSDGKQEAAWYDTDL